MTSALLDAIVSAPDDDAPRLVYADWLLERGDLCGEFITTQCTLTACIAAGDRTSDRYRAAWIQDYLFKRDHASRLAEAYGIQALFEISFERGLPVQATVDFAREGAAPLEHLPFKRLSLERNRPLLLGELRRILSLPLPASLEHIGFGKAFVSVDIDVALARDALTRTRAPDETRVWPDDCELPIPPFDATVRSYAGPPPMHVPLPPSLRDLLLTITGFDPFPRERWRELRTTEIEAIAVFCETDEEACAAIRAMPFERLRDFAIVASPSYGVAVAKAFAEAAAGAPALVGMGCTFPIDDAVARALEGSPLRLLRATGGGTRDALARILTRHPLHTLDLAEIAPSDAVSLLTSAAPPTLSNLRLDSFAFEDREVEALVTSERLARLVDLQLYRCALSPAALARLLDPTTLPHTPLIRADAATDARREPSQHGRPSADRWG